MSTGTVPLNTSAIDWELSLKLASGKKQLAIDMLVMLTKRLPEDKTLIEQAHAQHQLPELGDVVHKLHGGTCYVGVIGLRDACKEVQTAIKLKRFHQVDDLVAILLDEINSVLSCAEAYLQDKDE